MYVQFIPMVPIKMKLGKTLPLKDFKRNVGHSNHMLVTIYVGLETALHNNMTIDNTVNAVWNPKNKEVSINRAKVYTKNSALIFIVDNIDSYLNKVNYLLFDIIDGSLRENFDKHSQSVYKKLEETNKFFYNGSTDSIEYLFLQLLIKWRNKKAHTSAKNINFPANSITRLLQCKSPISENYRGLDVERMLSSFNESKEPTFKELTSLISASIKYIENLDSQIVEKVNNQKAAERILLGFCMENINNILCLAKDKKEKKFIQQLKQNGFHDTIQDQSVMALCSAFALKTNCELKNLTTDNNLIDAREI